MAGIVMNGGCAGKYAANQNEHYRQKVQRMLLLLTMIRAAGTGAAMENARTEVKRAADISAPDCDHDGVARVIETILNAR